MWRGFSNLAEKFSSQPYLRYLLAVPFLVVFVIGTYSLGRISGKSSKVNGDDSILLRERRDVVNPPPSSPTSAPLPSQSITTISSAGGAVYTRWGRTECPADSDVVYAGVVGGSLYNTHGGGSNPLCLPTNPLWGKYNENVEKGSKLYGAEYESPSGFDFANVGNRAPHDHNIPCVVCRSPTRNSALVIPARNVCYDGWNVEYTGYLMSGHPGQPGRTQFVCVDGSPESDPAGFRDENGALFYNVEGVCGSLPCPPYIQRREIVCAVCTK